MVSIGEKFNDFDNVKTSDRSALKEFGELGLFEKSKKEFKLVLAEAEKYRVGIIKGVSIL